METTRRRQAALPEGTPIGLSESFGADATKQAQWSACLRKMGLAEAPDLPAVVARLHDFIDPDRVLARHAPKDEETPVARCAAPHAALWGLMREIALVPRESRATSHGRHEELLAKDLPGMHGTVTDGTHPESPENCPVCNRHAQCAAHGDHLGASARYA